MHSRGSPAVPAALPMPLAVEVADLVKTYGPLRAVDGVSFQVEAGQIFGLLGPNGAGKSTTVEMVEGLRPADGGKIEVLGIDVRRKPRRVKERIGVQLQTTAFFKQLSARQLLALFGSFFPRALPVEQLIASVNLEEKADDASGNLSGGQRQRLAIAIALVNDPAVVFLDEPTTGLDPQARRSLWEVITRLKAEGKTVLLTTHYLEEAEQLCDELIFIDHGKVIAAGTPAGLIAEHFERTTLEFLSDDRLPREALEQPARRGPPRGGERPDQAALLQRHAHHRRADRTLRAARRRAARAVGPHGDAGGRVPQAHRAAHPRVTSPPMKAFRKLYRANLTEFLSNRRALFLTVAFPILFIVIFGLVFTNQDKADARIGVAAADPGDEVGKEIVKALQQVPKGDARPGERVDKRPTRKRTRSPNWSSSRATSAPCATTCAAGGSTRSSRSPPG